ncbi:MAG: phospholipase D-like domain-containing protein [Syntrophales bacterium]
MIVLADFPRVLTQDPELQTELLFCAWYFRWYSSKKFDMEVYSSSKLDIFSLLSRGVKMRINYIAQPDFQLGIIISDLLESDPLPSRIIFVSAFVSLQTVMRLKTQVLNLSSAGSDVRFVIGIDMGGTSQEVLRELLTWNISVFIVKHRVSGHTFHPKLYVLEWANRAEVIIGSHNLTEGGFFSNYEGSARITYDLPADSAIFYSAQEELARFVNPSGAVVYELNNSFLNELISRREIPTEAEARRNSGDRRRSDIPKVSGRNAPLFGIEYFGPPPPLPAELLERLIRDVRRRHKDNQRSITPRARKGRPALPIQPVPEDIIVPGAFYMTLPKLQGKNIPGEARIPLEAIELAQEFWVWPNEYARDVSPRSGREREYFNWRPPWKVSSAEHPERVSIQPVRMYMYTNSSDFRFYARPIVNAGGNLGDVVRIRRIAEEDVEYECTLARKGTPEYEEWIRYCRQPVRNSSRFFGYA